MRGSGGETGTEVKERESHALVTTWVGFGWAAGSLHQLLRPLNGALEDGLALTASLLALELLGFHFIVAAQRLEPQRHGRAVRARHVIVLLVVLQVERVVVGWVG